MLFIRFKFARFGLLPALLSKVLLAAATDAHDPCTIIAGQQVVDPAHAIACQKSFPFNETLRQNVLSVVSRVFDFYTFEDYYFDLPKPFHKSSTDIRAQIKRINSTRYAVNTPPAPSTAIPLMVYRDVRPTLTLIRISRNSYFS